MLWKTKPEDKLWREVNRKLDKKANVIFIFVMALLILYIGIDWRLDPSIIKGFSLGILIVISVITLQLYSASISLCRIIQKQQEQIDKLLEKAGIIKPKTEITIEVKDKLLNKLFELLLNEDAETRRFSAELLGDLGDKRALAPLINLLSDPDKQVVKTAKQVIEKLR